MSVQPHIDAEKKTWTYVENAVFGGRWEEGSNPDLEPDDSVLVSPIQGFACYLSAPGYLDKTETNVFETQAECAQYLLDTFYDLSDDELTDDEKRQVSELESIAKM